MKIAVIGASGRVGGLVVKEAASRGHQVTAIVRKKEKAAGLPVVDIIEKDVFNLMKADLEGFDAIVNAFGVNPGSGLEFQYETVMFTLCQILEQLPEVRILVVGGAASLYPDEKREKRIIEMGVIPEAWVAVPYHAWKSFMALQQSTCKWTYFSPAYTFDANGGRSGSYKLGRDVIFNNDQGESYLSYEDSAIAIVDELEQGNFIRQRFTAVSNRVGDAAPKKEEAPEENTSEPQESPAEEVTEKADPFPESSEEPAKAIASAAPETVAEAEKETMETPVKEEKKEGVFGWFQKFFKK